MQSYPFCFPIHTGGTVRGGAACLPHSLYGKWRELPGQTALLKLSCSSGSSSQPGPHMCFKPRRVLVDSSGSWPGSWPRRSPTLTTPASQPPPQPLLPPLRGACLPGHVASGTGTSSQYLDHVATGAAFPLTGSVGEGRSPRSRGLCLWWGNINTF